MDYILIISRECTFLSKAEAEIFLESESKISENKLYFILNELPKEIDLAYTREAATILFKSKENMLLLDAKEYDWESIIENPYSLEFEKGSFDDSLKKDLQKLVHESLKKPKVNLEDPKTRIKFYYDDGFMIATKLDWVNQDNSFGRKAHKRVFNHPTALDPKLARAMVNLAGNNLRVKKIIDPFCGAGGILIEAVLLGKTVVGYDIDRVQVNRANINLEALGLNAEVYVGDAFELEEVCDAIIADLPYGKNSKTNMLDSKLKNFFDKQAKFAKRIVVGAEKKMSLQKHFGDKWVVIHKFSIYIHKSMTKEIFVLELR